MKRNAMFYASQTMCWAKRCSVCIVMLVMVSELCAAESTTRYSGPKEKLHVYALLGGHYMAGHTPMTKDDSQLIDRCYLLNADGNWEQAKGPLNRYSTRRGKAVEQTSGPGLGFAKAMLAADPTVSIGLVVNAGDGKQNFIEHWRYKDDCYRDARRRIKTACKTGTLKGVLWHQNSHRIDSALSYYKDLVSKLRIDFSLLNLPVIVGEVPGKDGTAHNSMYHALVSDVHATGIASANELTLAGKELNADSMRLFGRRYAEQMLKVQKEWATKREVQPTIPVIDSHVHAQATKKGGLDIVAKWMERNNVERCISKPLTLTRAKTKEDRQVMLENFKKYEGKIYRFCLIEPEEVNSIEEAVAILKKEKADGAIGFGEHYGRGLMFDDPRNLRLYAACEQVGLPVHFHIDGDKNMDEKGLPRLEKVLKMFPKCVLIAHAQFWLEFTNGTCDRLLQTYPNLYAEPSGLRMAAVLNRDRTYTKKFLIRNADKILFATDAGWWSFGKSKADREIQFSLFEQLELPDDVKTKIYRTNAETLFRFGK